MKNTNLKIPTGTAIAAVNAALSTPTPTNGHLAAWAAGVMLTTPAPEEPNVRALKARTKFFKEMEALRDDQRCAGRLLKAIHEREDGSPARPLFAALVRAYNAQQTTAQRDQYVSQAVKTAKAAYWGGVKNTAAFHGGRDGFKSESVQVSFTVTNTQAYAEVDVMRSATRTHKRLQALRWKAVADEAMTDLLPRPQGLVVIGDAGTYGHLLGLKRSASLARGFQRDLARASDDVAPLLEAAIRLADGNGEQTDVELLAGGPATSGAADVIALLYPGLTLSEAYALLEKGQVTTTEPTEIRRALMERFVPVISAMALTFGRANARRFNHRIESAVSAFMDEGLRAVSAWRPWLPGAVRSFAEVVISRGSAGALRHTAVEWSQASGTLQGTELRRYTLVTSVKAEIVAELGFCDVEFIVAVLNMRGELSDGGSEFTQEEVELWLELEAQRYTDSLDAERGDADNAYTLGDIIPAPKDDDAEADAIIRSQALRDFAEEAELLEEMQKRDNAAYIAALPDEEAIEYLRMALNSTNTLVLRGMLTKIRTESAEHQAKVQDLMEANGFLRADGTSVFRVPTFTRAEIADWLEVLHVAGRPRVRPSVNTKALIAGYEKEGVTVPVLRKVVSVYGNANDETNLIRAKARLLLEQFFRNRLETRKPAERVIDKITGVRNAPSRLFTARDFAEATELLRHSNLDVSTNLIHQVANIVLNAKFRLDAQKRAEKRTDEIKAARKLLKIGGQPLVDEKPAFAAEAESQEENFDIDAEFPGTRGEQVEDFDIDAEFPDHDAA